MTYPSMQVDYDSTMSYTDALQTERATNGGLRGRSFWSAPKRTFRLVHKSITLAQHATLMTFYGTYRATSFSFTWAHDGASYSVGFTDVPKIKKTLHDGKLDVEVELAEV